MNEYVILKLTIKTLAFAVVAVAAAAAHAATQPQRPDNYPRKPVRLLVEYLGRRHRHGGAV